METEQKENKGIEWLDAKVENWEEKLKTLKSGKSRVEDDIQRLQAHLKKTGKRIDVFKEEN